MNLYDRFTHLFIDKEEITMVPITQNETPAPAAEASLLSASDKLRELTKLSFDVDSIWNDAVVAAVKIHTSEAAIQSTANIALDEYDHLGRILKIFGHDVEETWDTLVGLVKKHA